MTILEGIVLAGMLIIAGLGFMGRRHPNVDVTDWAVGGRAFGVLTTWLLQAGETFTTFTFLGTAGLVVAGGAGVFYSVPYVPLGYLALYFIAPVIWRRARARGHVTQADFLEESYQSRTLGVVAAVAGVVFLLPYLQLQITGLGLIVQLVTGDAASKTWSMVVGFLLVVAFVLWSGIRGVAATAYLKDILMLVVLLIICVGIPIHFTGGFTNVFHVIQRQAPEMLSVHGTGEFGIPWYISNMAISMIGVMFLTLPHMWPAILAARSSTVLRRNYLWLPIYNTFIVLPLVVGFVAFVVLGSDTDPDAALLQLAGQMFPEWFMGVVAVAGIATAMVPSAGLLIGMSTLVSRNIIRTGSGRQQLTITRLTVLVASFFSLLLALLMPNLLANLLLLTFSGLDQLAPAIALALFLPGRIDVRSVISGLVAGLAVVIALTFWLTSPWAISVGIIGLAINLAVVALVQAGLRLGSRRDLGLATAAEVASPPVA
ncbi:MAG: sodium:solute symporter family protein [Micrococcales bacterium]|nr:sodium:solute symporter family protein [Micrococcales bacterium]